LLIGGLSLPLTYTLSGPALRAIAQSVPGGAPADGVPFGPETVPSLARALAEKPHRPSRDALPKRFADLDYDAYRTIRFDGARSLWRGEDVPFEVQFFHRGFLFKDRVRIHEVVDGTARPVRYRSDMFDLSGAGGPTEEDMGFAGFRLHGPINRLDYLDEICTFLGASYFRAVAKNQIYGLSARGLAIRTADSAGEEFPVFTSFWIERPAPRAASVVIHALLDSQSATASFRFDVRPGETTTFAVEAAIFPRVQIDKVGIAPLTSMFLFSANDRVGIDDFRPAVHDSEGLSMWTGMREQLWRPLVNPAELQISTFVDTNPRGFGLMQRPREYRRFLDLEAHYEKRPSLWVEPQGDWGKGGIHLIEIPSKREINDNIVSFWRPEQPLRPNQVYMLRYRLHWGWAEPWNSELADIVDTRVGASWNGDARLFVLEAKGRRLERLPQGAAPRVEVTSDKGKIRHAVAQANPETGGWRMSFELLPEGARSVELRAQLMDGEGPLSEVWLYRWSP